MNSNARLGRWAIASAVAVMFLTAPAHAGIIASFQTVTANLGSTGNAFDVLLTNTGASAVAVDGFIFQITTTDLDITFTGTNISTTTPYIFAGDSLLGPNINTDGPGQAMDGGDFSLSNTNLVAAGATVGLGHVLFDVSPAAMTGTFELDFVPAGTSLTDNVGQPVTIDSLVAGELTIQNTPEPASAFLLGSALIGLAGLKFRCK
ncbi:MAG TPA: hypothetical protein VKU19_07150 [Bryobacteraceae bacterium]|nr:hypothetical protein [Bryobacteraceae bacterium]